MAIDPRDGLAQLTDLALRSLPETRTWLHRHHGADLVNGERKKKTLHQIALYIYITHTHIYIYTRIYIYVYIYIYIL